jgi:hypothetical protein
MCVSVSDWSFKEQYGTATWAIGAESNAHRLTRVDVVMPTVAAESRVDRYMGVNIVPGVPMDQSAYRSEVAGIPGIAIATTGTVYLGCDGHSTLDKNCTDVDYVVKPASPHLT